MNACTTRPPFSNYGSTLRDSVVRRRTASPDSEAGRLAFTRINASIHTVMRRRDVRC